MGLLWLDQIWRWCGPLFRRKVMISITLNFVILRKKKKTPHQKDVSFKRRKVWVKTREWLLQTQIECKPRVETSWVFFLLDNFDHLIWLQQQSVVHRPCDVPSHHSNLIKEPMVSFLLLFSLKHSKREKKGAQALKRNVVCITFNYKLFLECFSNLNPTQWREVIFLVRWQCNHQGRFKLLDASQVSWVF